MSACSLVWGSLLLLQGIVLSKQEFAEIPKEATSVPPQNITIHLGDTGFVSAGVSYRHGEITPNVFKSKVKLYSFDGATKYAEADFVLNQGTPTVVLTPEFDDKGVKYSVEVDNSTGFGVALFRISQLTLSNVPNHFQISRDILDKNFNTITDVSYFTAFVVGVPDCSVSTNGGSIPLADSITPNNLTCDVTYSPAVNTDLPHDVNVTWSVHSGTGKKVTDGARRLVRNSVSVVLDAATYEGRQLVCRKFVHGAAQPSSDSCSTPPVHSLPRNVRVEPKPVSASYYPSTGLLTLRCSADGFPSPNFRWLVNGVQQPHTSSSFSPDLSSHASSNVTFTCVAENRAGGTLRSINGNVTVIVQALTTSSTTSSTVSMTTTTTPNPEQGETKKKEDNTLTYALVGVLVPLAVIVAVIVVVLVMRRRTKKPADEDRPPKVIEFDNESPSSDVKKPISPEGGPGLPGPEHMNEAYNEMQFDNRPGSRRPIASPLETTESLGSAYDSQQQNTPSLSPYSSLQRPNAVLSTPQRADPYNSLQRLNQSFSTPQRGDSFDAIQRPELHSPSNLHAEPSSPDPYTSLQRSEHSYTPVRATPVIVDPYGPREPSSPHSPPPTFPKPNRSVASVYPDVGADFDSGPPSYSY